MGDDDWEPREHDHLVEPLFGGLEARREERPGWLRRVGRWLRALLGRPRG